MVSSNYLASTTGERCPTLGCLLLSPVSTLSYCRTRSTLSPAQTYECLATGKPVVAADLPAMRDLAGYVYIAQRPDDYVDVLRNLQRLETEEKRRARIDLAHKNSWDTRFRALEEALWRHM